MDDKNVSAADVFRENLHMLWVAEEAGGA